MTSFTITSARAFLHKLHDEQNDFVASHCLSARHALNAIITGYHLHEWVWGEWRLGRRDLVMSWGVNSATAFGRCLGESYCPAFSDARKIANGTKHFGLDKLKTGQHGGAFDRGAFDSGAFDVDYLWIERDGREQPAEEFIKEIVDFWDRFFLQYSM